MNDLIRCCKASHRFPKLESLLDSCHFSHHLDDHFEKLDRWGDKLFVTEETRTALYFVQLDLHEGGKWGSHRVQSLAKLETHFALARDHATVQQDSKCLFLFLWAGHSLDHLFTTRDMLMKTFTYLQVAPEFLDFVYPFGRQQFPKESCFNEFRSYSRIAEIDRGLAIPQLQRSGRHIRLCYSLKGVEPSISTPQSPYSVRHCSLYNEFDIETGKTVWIFIKGNTLFRDRISKELRSARRYCEMSPSSSVDQMLAACFNIHFLVSDWAGDHWRWYLTFLEGTFETITNLAYAVAVPVATDVNGDDAPDFKLMRSRSELHAVSDTSTAKWFSLRGRSPKRSIQVQQAPPSPPTEPHLLHSGFQTREAHEQETKAFPAQQQEPRPGDFFKFSDLQRVQSIKEKVAEAQLCLETNAKVVTELRTYFTSLQSLDGWPGNLRNDHSHDFIKFIAGLNGVEKQMLMLQARAVNLLCRIENRRSMLYASLEYMNINASKKATNQSLSSTVEMAGLTKEMHHVALKTARQTALMTIIAFVTVVYLPATLMATVMSTPIVQWQESEEGKRHRRFSKEALETFLEVALPLTGLTLIICTALWFRNRSRSKTQEVLYAKLC